MDPLANQELTSEVFRNLIKRAKEAGVNISAITNQLLRALTDQRIEGNTFNDVVNTYQKLFDAMKPIILPYCFSATSWTRDDVTVTVGNAPERDQPLELSPIGLIWVGETNEDVSIRDAYYHLYEPMEILYNLISELSYAADANKRKIKGIDDALRLVKAMSDDIENKDLSRSEVSV
jgi:hypothetical protein